jgi:hypothetical protein
MNRYQAHPSRTAYRAPYRSQRRAIIRQLVGGAIEFLVLVGIFLLVPLVLYLAQGI